MNSQMPPIVSETKFEQLWRLGFKRLVPIVPPDATISERSTLAKRVGTSQDSRGKAVGVKGCDGKWAGFDWLCYDADERDLGRWHGMHAGVGIKLGQGLVAIDADTLDENSARIIRDIIEREMGRMPIRVGRYPKALYLCRVSEAFRYSRIEFGTRNKKNQLSCRVEILSDGRQFVAYGIHPNTGKPYTWPREIVPFEALPLYTPQQLTHLLEMLAQALPSASPIIREGGQQHVNQATLTGDIDAVRKAVEAIPNTSEGFPSRESYLHVGYAIKAALPDAPSEAFNIFADWCARWTDGDNDPHTVAADWQRMKPPYRRGANWLFELAEACGGGSFSRADGWFQPIEATEDIPGKYQIASIHPAPYSFRPPSEIPPRPWLYGDHYLAGVVSATVAPGGLGKSSLTIVEALAMASGKPLLGVTPRKICRVWLWNGEDPIDELERRIGAAMKYYGLSAADIADRLMVNSGMDTEIVVAVGTREGAKIVSPVVDAVERAIKDHSIDLMIIDPFVSSHRIPENDNNATDLVVKKWARIAHVSGCAIELVHHVRKTNGQETTVEDARGSSAFIAAVRSARALTRMTRTEGNSRGIENPWAFFRSGGVTKSNMAPAMGAGADNELWFTTTSVELGNGDQVGVVKCVDLSASAARLTDGAGDIDPEAVDKTLKIIGDEEWRGSVQSGNWIGHAVAEGFGLDSVADRDRVKTLVSCMARQGLIETYVGRDGSRKPRQFVRRATVNTTESANVFG